MHVAAWVAGMTGPEQAAYHGSKSVALALPLMILFPAAQRSATLQQLSESGAAGL